jgi:hypothetical protein
MITDEKNKHPLLHALRSRNAELADRANRLIQESPRLLEFTLSTFPGFTDHTQRHTCTVEKIGRLVLSDAFLGELTDEELFFLVVACHYHDLALAGTEADEKTPETRDQVRQDHAIRIGDIIREKWAELGFESPRLADILGEVCRGHRPKKNAEGIANWEELKKIEVLGPGTSVRVRLISALIYAIDELHLGADRAPERVQNWRNIQDDESRRHWRRHQAVSGPVSNSPSSLLFSVSADTPEFEENLRSQVFRKAFSAVNDLRRQAGEDRIAAQLPSIIVQWDRRRTWGLLLIVVMSDMKPRSKDQIVQSMLDRFKQDTTEKIELDGVCTETGNSEMEMNEAAKRSVADAFTKRELVTSTGVQTELQLSTTPSHADGFFERCRQADGLDLLFVGRFRESWEQMLFASEFGRRYVQSTVFPAVERTYAVHLSQRPANDPIRVLLESCPTAARLVTDYAPSSSNLVKDTLLIQAVATGALMDFHTNPDRLLDAGARAAIRTLTIETKSISQNIRLLEELALVGGLTHEQISAAAIPSKAAQDYMDKVFPAPNGPCHINVSQTVSAKAGGTTHLPRLLLASQRAGTPILLAATSEYELTVTVSSDDESKTRDTRGAVLGMNPRGAHPPASFKMPARIEVSRTTRTIRFYLGQFSVNEPTAYPVILTLPSPSEQKQGQRSNFRVRLHWSELTVRDLRTVETANQVIRDSSARVELIIEKDGAVLGTLTNPSGKKLFVADDEISYQRALRGVDGALPAPFHIKDSILKEMENLGASERTLRWQEFRSDENKLKFSSIYIRLTNSEGQPLDEEFIRFFPFNLIPTPEFTDTDQGTGAELQRQWTEAEQDFTITAYFAPDIHDLAQSIHAWCDKPADGFPFRFFGDPPPEPSTRSMITVRLLRRRDRTWYVDRPIIFDLRPVNEKESYQMEAEYWRKTGDERRAQLAQEICDRVQPSTASIDTTQPLPPKSNP